MKNNLRRGMLALCAVICILLAVSGCRVGVPSDVPSDVTSDVPSDDAAAAAVTAAPSAAQSLPGAQDPTEPVSDAPETEAPAAAGAEAPADADLTAALDAVAARYGCSAAQVGIIDGSGSVRYYSCGTMDADGTRPVGRDSKFRCASLSKLVIGMTAMALQEQGRFDINTDVGQILGFAVRNPSYPDTPITAKMLMTHTSSLADGEAFLASRNSASSEPLSSLLHNGGNYCGYRPGTAYTYSNFGAAVLAAALEKATGTGFGTLADQLLFEPLGITAAFSAAELPDVSQVAALHSGGGTIWSVERQLRETPSGTLGQTHHLYQGNLTISAADYAKLLGLLLSDGAYAGRQILSKSSVEEIAMQHIESGGVRQGYFVEINEPSFADGDTVLTHTGSNYGMYSSFAVDRARGLGVVVFTGGATASLNARDGLYDVCDEMISLCFGRSE